MTAPPNRPLATTHLKTNDPHTMEHAWCADGPLRELNPGPLGPKPGIIPLDQAADCTEWIGNGIQTQLCEHCRRFAHCQFIWRGYVVNAGPVFCHSTAGMQFTRLFPNGTALWYPNTSAAWIWDGQWH